MKAKKIHFIGIGGISMSSLAEILNNEGIEISGSDASASAITNHLQNIGISVKIGQKAENILGDEDLIVYTAAISDDNPELVAARKTNARVIDRATLIGEMMLEYKHPVSVAGTHGKTTTSSMLSQVFLDAGADPTVSIGGILPSINGNYRVGGKDYFVLESCEYCDSFLKFNPFSAIILNVDADHLDYFKNIDNIYASFNKFAKKLPPEGTLVINNKIERLGDVTKDVKANIVTYGDENADYYPINISYDEFGKGEYTLCKKGKEVCKIKLGVPGEHNVYNSVAVFAMASVFKVPEDKIISGIASFSGTDRRFQYKGEFNGVKVIDDYAHHPTEIAATISSARANKINNLRIIFQPHTYTRTLSLIDDFAKVLSIPDEVILLDIYASREKDTGLVTSRDLEKKIKEVGGNVKYCASFSEAEEYAKNVCQSGDMLITVGAGDVYKIGESLVKKQ